MFFFFAASSRFMLAFLGVVVIGPGRLFVLIVSLVAPTWCSRQLNQPLIHCAHASKQKLRLEARTAQHSGWRSLGLLDPRHKLTGSEGFFSFRKGFRSKPVKKAKEYAWVGICLPVVPRFLIEPVGDSHLFLAVGAVSPLLTGNRSTSSPSHAFISSLAIGAALRLTHHRWQGTMLQVRSISCVEGCPVNRKTIEYLKLLPTEVRAW